MDRRVFRQIERGKVVQIDRFRAEMENLQMRWWDGQYLDQKCKAMIHELSQLQRKNRKYNTNRLRDGEFDQIRIR